MTPDQAAISLRQGKPLNVDLDTGIAALALTVPHLFRHIDPTQTDGKGALSKFRKLSDFAGLPHDHSVFASWLTLRALRVQPGDAVIIEFDCPVTHALVDALGLVATSNDAHVIRNDRTNPDAISITADAPIVGEAGVIATPGGVIRIPNTKITCTQGSWATALASIEKITGELGRKAYDADPDAVITLDYIRPVNSTSVDADSIHEDWKPEIAFHADLMPHPARLIQSATLATVIPPVTTYRPRLPSRVIKSGLISNAQFEFLVAAGEAHGRHLPIDQDAANPTEYRCGIFLADGTGAGKTNEILGTILDNMLQGRTKAILVLSKRRHRHGFLETWAKMGRDRRELSFQWDLKPDQNIRAASGILVTTYSTIRDYESSLDQYPRIEQIKKWVGSDFAGIMAFDEAQDMRNAAGYEDYSNRSETSLQGLAGIALQNSLPGARVVYASATGATDAHNLAYAVRLGLWGEGTCFKNRSDFIQTFEKGGISDLEQVTLSAKAAGVYVSRSLSFDGVDTRHLPVTLTKEERQTYNEAATSWNRLWDAYNHCAGLCGIPIDDEDKLRALRAKSNVTGATPFSELNGIFEANRKNSMATLIAAFKARAVIADAKEQIDKGNAVVIQMQNTYEAQLNRAINRMENPQNIRLEPAELLAFAERIPVEVQEVAEYTDAEGKARKRFQTALDDQGNAVLNPEAVAIRNNLIADMRQLKLPLPPLDQIMLAMGPGRLAEVTGRSKRLIPNKPNGDRDGATGVELEDRNEKDRIQDIEDFHNGKKLALVFSTGAGGSSLSYHAKQGTKNTRRRIHYVIQLGYRADEVTQGIGRTHRSDQTVPPVLTIVSCDLPADRLYASRIVSALFKLGALTQGHRHAASNGMFDERDCLDGHYAAGAWDDLQDDIKNDLIPDYCWDKFMSDMGLTIKGKNGETIDSSKRMTSILTNINKMINRVAALTDRRQELIFEMLRQRIDTRIEKAISNGTFNAGPEILKAKSLQIVGEKTIYKDAVHGSETRLLRIRKKSELATNSFGDAYKSYLLNRGSSAGQFCKHRTTGQIALITVGKPLFDAFDNKISTRNIMTPTSLVNRYTRIVDREPWIPFADMDIAEALWNAQVEAAPRETTSYLTIVADGLLPIWKAIGIASGFRSAVYRIQTDDGRQIVGRPLNPHKMNEFFKLLEESPAPTDMEVAEIMTHLQNGDRVALCAEANKIPHMLSATFKGRKMVGLTLELGAGASTSLSIWLDQINNGGTRFSCGTQIKIAENSGEIEQALKSVMTYCPALYIEEDEKSSPIAVPVVPAQTGQAMAA